MTQRRKTAFWGIGLAVVSALVGAAVASLLMAGSNLSGDGLETVPQYEASAGAEDPPQGEESVIHVRTIRPQRNPSFVLKVSEVAYVEPYYQADILSQLPGRVKYI